jgi:hypothetical protein
LTGARRGRFDPAEAMPPPRQIYVSAAQRRMRHRRPRTPFGPARAAATGIVALLLVLAAFLVLGGLG